MTTHPMPNCPDAHAMLSRNVLNRSLLLDVFGNQIHSIAKDGVMSPMLAFLELSRARAAMAFDELAATIASAID